MKEFLVRECLDTEDARTELLAGCNANVGIRRLPIHTNTIQRDTTWECLYMVWKEIIVETQGIKSIVFRVSGAIPQIKRRDGIFAPPSELTSEQAH